MRLPAALAVVIASALLRWSAVAAEPTPPAETLRLVREASPPVRDLPDLRARVVAPAPGASGPPAASDGQALWVTDLANHTYHLVPVDLRYVSQHADWFVEAGRDPGDLASAADFFETQTLPRIEELTGVRWQPGDNGQPRLGIFNGQTRGVTGYMSASDVLPRSVFPYSNERLMVYLSLDSVRPGSHAYNATLAHELEHLAHFVVNPVQEGWLDEGLAELASSLVVGDSVASVARFLEQPDVQLTAWSEKPWEAGAHYQASYLWARYLMERGGGPAALHDLVRSGGRGLETSERFARAYGLEGGLEGVFRDWLVANLLADANLADGRFGYQGQTRRAALVGSLEPDGPLAEGTVHQFAADYFELPTDAGAELRVEVSPTVPLIGADDVHGAFFWSLRGDNLDTRLTRRFDLGGVEHATLRYRVWYDLETDYDVCYVLGSSDGVLWLPLAGHWTSNADNLGAILGPGYTGSSGGPAGWLRDEVDLTPFAGRAAYVRFECVTDQSYSGPGFALDELAVPEIGFADDAESDQGWSREGFVRAPNQMAQPAAILAVLVGDSSVTVQEVSIDAAGHGQLALPAADRRRAAVAIAGLAPLTLEQMPYRLWLTRL